MLRVENKNCGILCSAPDHVKLFFPLMCHEFFHAVHAYSSYLQAASSQTEQR